MYCYIIFTVDILEKIAIYIDDPVTWLSFALTSQTCRKICNKEYMKIMKFPDFTFVYVFLNIYKPDIYKKGRPDGESYVPIKYSLRSVYNFLGLDINDISKKENSNDTKQIGYKIPECYMIPEPYSYF